MSVASKLLKQSALQGNPSCRIGPKQNGVTNRLQSFESKGFQKAAERSQQLLARALLNMPFTIRAILEKNIWEQCRRLVRTDALEWDAQRQLLPLPAHAAGSHGQGIQKRVQWHTAESDSIRNLLPGSATHPFLKRASCYQCHLEVCRVLPASGTSGRDAHPITWAVVHHFWIARVAPRLRTFGEAVVVHDSAWHLGSRLPKPPSRRVCKQVCNEASVIQM